MAHEVPIRLLDVGPQIVLGQRLESAAPDHVVHAAVQAELVSLGLERLQLGNESEPHRPREGRLHQEAGPAGLLNEVDRLAVGELGLGAREPGPQPFPEVGGTAEIDEEGIGDAEVAARRADAREPVGDADPVIDVPAKRKQPIGHRPVLGVTSA